MAAAAAAGGALGGCIGDGAAEGSEASAGAAVGADVLTMSSMSMGPPVCSAGAFVAGGAVAPVTWEGGTPVVPGGISGFYNR